MASSCYKYERIDLATDAIRLVRLLKGDNDETIRCKLFQTYLSSSSTVGSGEDDEHAAARREPMGVPYEALSYTWGRKISDDKILLDGYEFEVTENLYHALKNLRQADQDRILWIDAICIDQGHNAVSGISRVLVTLGTMLYTGD